MKVLIYWSLCRRDPDSEVVAYLKGLSQIKRFDMNIKFLPKPQLEGNLAVFSFTPFHTSLS